MEAGGWKNKGSLCFMTAVFLMKEEARSLRRQSGLGQNLDESDEGF